MISQFYFILLSFNQAPSFQKTFRLLVDKNTFSDSPRSCAISLRRKEASFPCAAIEMSSFSTPGITGSKSFSFLVDCSQKIWSPDRLEPGEGDLLRADPEAWRFSPLLRPRRAAPPLRARGEYSSRAEKSVTRLLCPQGPFQGGRGRGKPLC